MTGQPDAPTLRDDLVTLAAIRRVQDLLGDLDKKTRARVLAELGSGGRGHAEAGGHRLGTIMTTDPKGGWRVADRDAFIRWCQQEKPTAVETTVAVRASDEKAILADITSGGEVPDGVEWFDAGAPYVKVAQTPEQGEAVEAALRSGLVPAVAAAWFDARQIEGGGR